MGRTERRPNKDDDGARRRVLAIDDFAHRKGVTKAIQDCRKRKEKKRTATAKALRSYRKTMKQEGFTPGQGASRKRNNGDTKVTAAATTDSNDEKEKEETTMNNTTSTTKQHQEGKKFHKTNPFQQSLRKAKESKQKKQQDIVDREAHEKEREQKLKQRRKRSKQLRQRTSKGQPVMKHVIGDILRKLERDKQQEEQQG
ncbi:expressed unknown protein [Seminavis robusta]|uniref:Uncharacterized protein n=1 Tax=Seminavis robusta TaxID=568900 RepID=A0A9N8H030_9STRA|nr:expressed unknown protein [Seminavis robusta]|eukprot:Sro13_g010030.1 n/a (199) ;mRNA; f:102129-102725